MTFFVSPSIQPIHFSPLFSGAEVLRAYNWKTFTEVGGPAAAFKAADGDYHVVCPLRRFALEAVSQVYTRRSEREICWCFQK